MPHTRAAKKSLRKDAVRNLRNRAERSAMRLQLKKAREAAGGAGDGAKTEVQKACSVLDRSARKQLIHPNTAARLKSRLMKKANAAAATTKQA